MCEPDTARVLIGFRKDQRFWSGSPEETQQLIFSLTDALKHADSVRSAKREPLQMALPENIEELIDHTFDAVDMKAIVAAPEYVDQPEHLPES